MRPVAERASSQTIIGMPTFYTDVVARRRHLTRMVLLTLAAVVAAALAVIATFAAQQAGGEVADLEQELTGVQQRAAAEQANLRDQLTHANADADSQRARADTLEAKLDNLSTQVEELEAAREQDGETTVLLERDDLADLTTAVNDASLRLGSCVAGIGSVQGNGDSSQTFAAQLTEFCADVVSSKEMVAAALDTVLEQQ